MLDPDLAAVFGPDSAADDRGHHAGIAVVFGAFDRIPIDLRTHSHQEGAQAGKEGQQEQDKDALDDTGRMTDGRLTVTHLSIFPPLSATLMEGIRLDAIGS